MSYTLLNIGGYMSKYTLLERFMEKVTISDSCWHWNAMKNSYGYGLIWVNGKPVRAHRVSFSLFNGELSEEDVVMHSCDNPSCVKPSHLSVGTRLENNRDAVAKRRNQFGEKHWAAKLTTEQVESVRNMKGTYTQIAKIFGVSQSAISRIKTGKRRSKG
jgi:hypothetical protein